jgi:HEAT repeat protein/lysophospholipase L1-like esterase
VLKNLLLSLCTVGVLLAALEGMCRFVEPREATPAVASYITDWAQWEGNFYTVKSTAAGWPPFEDYNHDGLRDREHHVAKLPGVRRLVCLGDSTTAGYRIRPEEAYPQLLQDLVDSLGYDVEVFNVALGGWSTHQELLAYRRIVRKYRPDVVLVGICLNDIPELGNNLSRPPAWLAVVYRSSALMRRLVAASDREIRSIEELFVDPQSPKVRGAYANLFEHLQMLRDEVHADGADLGVLVFPFRMQIEPDAPPPRPQQQIAAFCEAEGIPYLDLLPAIRAAGEEAFVDYDHFSPFGSEVVADQILAAGLVVPDTPGGGPPEAPTGLAGGWAPMRELLESLGDPDPARRADAARALGQVGGSSGAALPALAARLGDPDDTVRAAAAWALGRLGARPGVDLPALAARLADTSPSVRAAAAWAIGRLGAGAKGVAPELVARLSDPDADVRRRAVEALERVHPNAATCLPEVVALLGEGRNPGRAEAARVVGFMGASAASAAPALATALHASDLDVRREAVAALGKIGPGAEPAVPALIEAMSDPELRWRVPDALASIGPRARGATAVLIEALKDPSATVRWRAALALGRIQPSDAGLGVELARLSGDPQANVRLGAVIALARIEADADLRVRTFSQALGDETAEVRRKAADSLGRMGPEAHAAVPQLLGMLRDPDAWARVNAVRALGRIGKGSPAVATALQAALNDPDEMVKTQATTALRQVSTDSR